MNTQNTQLFNQTTNQIKEELYYEYFDNEIFEKMTDDLYEIQYLEELRYEMLKRNYYGEMLFNCDEYDDKHLNKLHKLALSIDVFNEKDENINERCILKYFNIFNYFKSKITTTNKIKMSEELENDILENMMIRRKIEVSMIPYNYLLDGGRKTEKIFIHARLKHPLGGVFQELEKIYESENVTLKRMIIERNDEINDIRCNLTHYNYFVRVFKNHYGQKRMNEASFPLVLYDYINKIDNCLKYKMKFKAVLWRN